MGTSTIMDVYISFNKRLALLKLVYRMDRNEYFS